MSTGVLFGVGLAALAAVALAGQSLAVRLGTKTRSVTTVIASMYGVNVMVLVPASVVGHHGGFGLTSTSIASFAISGLLGSLLARYYLFVGIHRLGATRAEPLKSTFPLIAIVSAVVLLDEGLTPTLLSGIVLLVAGTIAVTWEARSSPITASGRRVWTDVGYPLAAALLLGVDPIFTKTGLAEGTPALVGVTLRILAASVGFGMYLLWRHIRTGSRPAIEPNRWVALASVANTIYLAAYFAALARAPVSVVTPILGTSPLLVILGGAAFIQREEHVTVRLGIAGAVIVAGVILVLLG